MLQKHSKVQALNKDPPQKVCHKMFLPGELADVAARMTSLPSCSGPDSTKIALRRS